MTSRRTTLWSSFLCAGMIGFAMPAMAGFEFSAAPAPAPAAALPSQQEFDAAMLAPQNAPMPIVPTAPVQAEALPPLQPADMITQPLAIAASGSEPVYVRRQRPDVPPSQVTVSASSNSGLVINPYPLQANGVEAVHGNDSTDASIEQAMMEQTGKLRTVVTPGNNGAGMISRAENSPRIGAAPILAPREVYQNMASVGQDGLMPMPGGEGPDLNTLRAHGDVEAQNLMPAVAAPSYPRPAPVYPNAEPVQVNYAPLASGGFSEAVGFGKELPLALALSQVVPPEYNYAFGQNVDPGETVSWKGGKSWDAVLQEMLQPAGLRAVINGKQVLIRGAV